MGALSAKLRSIEGGRIGFWCPGCDEMHVITTGPDGWGYNGDPNRPTFTPSVLVTSGHFMPGHKGPDCWCNFKERTGRESHFKCKQCHSFVTDGNIQFLGDSNHALANQTVPLPDFPLEN